MLQSQNQFIVFSPSYENISNRINRLSKDKTSNTVQLRQNSVNHKIDLNILSSSINDIASFRPKRRLSPSPVAPNEHNYPS